MQRIRERLTYANVMSTLGVFLALGGGYAIASSVKGDGRVIQKGKAVGSDFETVAKVPGVVRVQARCSGALQISIRNDSGAAIELDAGVGNDTDVIQILPGVEETYSGDGNLVVQAFRPQGNGKPMASLTISGKYQGTCAVEHFVAVTAVSSE
jgi:hypothetical protein